MARLVFSSLSDQVEPKKEFASVRQNYLSYILRMTVLIFYALTSLVSAQAITAPISNNYTAKTNTRKPKTNHIKFTNGKYEYEAIGYPESVFFASYGWNSVFDPYLWKTTGSNNQNCTLFSTAEDDSSSLKIIPKDAVEVDGMGDFQIPTPLSYEKTLDFRGNGKVMVENLVLLVEIPTALKLESISIKEIPIGADLDSKSSGLVQKVLIETTVNHPIFSFSNGTTSLDGTFISFQDQLAFSGKFDIENLQISTPIVFSSFNSSRVDLKQISNYTLYTEKQTDYLAVVCAIGSIDLVDAGFNIQGVTFSTLVTISQGSFSFKGGSIEAKKCIGTKSNFISFLPYFLVVVLLCLMIAFIFHYISVREKVEWEEYQLELHHKNTLERNSITPPLTYEEKAKKWLDGLIHHRKEVNG
jgi:hypothetical protein